MEEGHSLAPSELGQLRTALEAGRYTFFIGAGVSIEAGFPSARHLVEILQRSLYPSALTAKDAEESFCAEYAFHDELTLGKVTQAIEHKIGRPRLIALLRDSFDWEGDPGFVHRSLAKISLAAGSRDNPLRVITPNFDTLLEDAFGPWREVVVTHDDFLSARPGRPWVLKIHGCIRQNPQATIVITEDDRSLELPEWKVRALSESTRGKGLIILGYSGMDEHLNRFIWRGIEESDQLAYPSYWLAPDRVPKPVSERLEEFGGEPLLMEALQFFEQLGFGS